LLSVRLASAYFFELPRAPYHLDYLAPCSID
jgi:hypothetical protein